MTDELVQTYLPDLNELMSITRIIMSVTGLLFGIGIFCLLLALILYLKYRKLACIKENQVVSNISMIGSGNTTRKDIETIDKRLSYNIPHQVASERLTVQTF